MGRGGEESGEMKIRTWVMEESEGMRDPSACVRWGHMLGMLRRLCNSIIGGLLSEHKSMDRFED